MKKLFNRSFLIFCVIGVINTLTHLAVFNQAIGLGTVLANTVAFIIASLFSYWANATFTYRTEMKFETFFSSMLTFLVKLLLSDALTFGFERLLFHFNREDLIPFIPIPVTAVLLPLQFFVFNYIFKKRA